MTKKIKLLIYLALTLLCLGLGIFFVKLDLNHVSYQHEIYSSVNTTVIDHIVMESQCSKGYRYTGSIIVSYSVNHNYYFDEKKVLCGSSFNNTKTQLESKYPIGEILHMYYNNKEPDGGVYFYIDYNNYYWAGAAIFFTGFFVNFSLIFLVT